MKFRPRYWLILLLVGVNILIGMGLAFLSASTVGVLLALLAVVAGGMMALVVRRQR